MFFGTKALTVDGNYGPLTQQAVELFQVLLQHRNRVSAPATPLLATPLSPSATRMRVTLPPRHPPLRVTLPSAPCQIKKGRHVCGNVGPGTWKALREQHLQRLEEDTLLNLVRGFDDQVRGA